jgi:hypothetical protein
MAGSEAKQRRQRKYQWRKRNNGVNESVSWREISNNGGEMKSKKMIMA